MKGWIACVWMVCAAIGVEAAVQERVIAVEGAELFCRSMGEGDPVVVIHGGPGLSQDYLLPGMKRLAEDHQVIFYDQRGCGCSTGEIGPESINLVRYVKDLDAIRKGFGLEKVSVLGHSWGGFLAVEYAMEHPEVVDKLILTNCVPLSSEGFALFVQEWNRRMEPFKGEMERIHSLPGFHEGDSDAMESLYRLIFRTYCYDSDKVELLHVRSSPEAIVNGLKVRHLIRQEVFCQEFDLHPRLRALKVPTLVIHGDTDPVPASGAEKIYESIPEAEYVLMEHCGHFPYVEDPEVFFSHINAFLKEGGFKKI